MTQFLNFLSAVAVLAVAAIAARWYPFLGGIIAMFPVKAIGYIIITGADQEGIKGMLIGTLVMTVPFLVIAYLIFGRS